MTTENDPPDDDHAAQDDNGYADPAPEDVDGRWVPPGMTPEEAEAMRLAEPPEPTKWPALDSKVSCVMPTTSKRRFCIERSIRCWQKQTWEHRDLLVLHDGDRKSVV